MNAVVEAEGTPNEAAMDQGEDKAVEGMILVLVPFFFSPSPPFFLFVQVFMQLCFMQRKEFLISGLLQ